MFCLKNIFSSELRLGILPLEIEKGDFVIFLVKIICVIFCKNVVEHEIHFVCLC